MQLISACQDCGDDMMSLEVLGGPTRLARLCPPRTWTFDMALTAKQSPPTPKAHAGGHTQHRPACRRHRYRFAQLEYQRCSANASSSAPSTTTTTQPEPTTCASAHHPPPSSYQRPAPSQARRHAPNAHHSAMIHRRLGPQPKARLGRRPTSTLQRRRPVRTP